MQENNFPNKSYDQYILRNKKISMKQEQDAIS